MKSATPLKRILCLLLALALAAALPACASQTAPQQPQTPEETGEGPALSRYLTAVEDEPDTVDFQCTTIYYTVATNVFNRLVEMENDENGDMVIRPSLAESWEVSEDGLRYTFHLRDKVRFSNGAPLSSSDVLYTLTRLLTHPQSSNRDIADEILGAEALMNGEADTLEGFEILSDRDFVITLAEPFAAFLACLSMPGGSILDEETTREAGERFGTDPAWTIGTGSFILQSWTPGVGMTLVANPDCWEGPPASEGLNWLFLTEPEDVRSLFESGCLDILDLDDLNNSAEFFFHGDIYQDRLHPVQRIAITYIALNESIAPLDDVRVRRALQLGLNRANLLDAVYDGHGYVENGLFPHGLYGFNPELPEIPYDPEQAKALLEEAGYPDGFELEISVRSSSIQKDMILLSLVSSMWGRIGVKANIKVMDESEFMRLRKSGGLACYSAMWTADFNDPDNFIYTFFGSADNTRFRSLCYPREDIMRRVREARYITSPELRLEEYRALEKTIVQEDAAWIPLCSRLHYYVTGERVSGFRTSWNGSVKNCYRYFSVSGE